jgi:Ca-activated chloride channel family protein
LVALGVAAWLAVDLAKDGLRLERPWALLLLLAAPLVALFAVHRESRGLVTLSFSRGADVESLAVARGFWARFRGAPVAFRLVALALLAVALARPRTYRPSGEIELQGIDIMLVLDLSNSMQDRDLVPDRLSAAKHVIDDFIVRRKSDRIGLVVFGREAFTYCPLTLDYSTLRTLLGDLSLGLLDGRGTSIGNALGTAVARLRKSDAKSKVVVLLTDGDSNAGNLSPEDATRLAQSAKVRVFTVLVGDPSAREAGAGSPPRQQYAVNPRLLEQISAATGGTPYVATDTRALENRFHAILEELDRSKLRDVGAMYGEAFPRFAWPALWLCLADVALRLTRLRRFP